MLLTWDYISEIKAVAAQGGGARWCGRTGRPPSAALWAVSINLMVNIIIIIIIIIEIVLEAHTWIHMKKKKEIKKT